MPNVTTSTMPIFTKSLAIGSFTLLLLAGFLCVPANGMAITNSETIDEGFGATANDSTVTNEGTIHLVSPTQDHALYVIGTGNQLINGGLVDCDITVSNVYYPISGYGMYASGGENTLSNTNTITIDASASFTGDADASAHGMYAKDGYNALTNDGAITLTILATTAADVSSDSNVTIYAYGMAGLGNENILTNNGTITIDGDANATAQIAEGTAYAYAMYANGDTNELTNKGTIEIFADATASGEGNPLTDADADAYGMYADGNLNTLTNWETITVETSAQATSNATIVSRAYGIYANGTGNDLINHGSISVSTVADYWAQAYGMQAYGTGNALYNGESIVVSASSAPLSVTTTSYAQAYGMSAWSGSNELVNGENGVINVTATAVGAGTTAHAYGMYVTGTDNKLDNFGSITVSGTTAGYQAYVAANGSASVGTWSLLLGEDYGLQADGSTYYVFGVGKNATLTFADSSGQPSSLVVTGLGSSFVEGKKYYISDMIDISADGTVSGAFGQATSAYAFVDVELYGNDITFSKDDADQYLVGTLNVTPDNSPAQGATNQTYHAIFNNMNKMSSIVSTQLATPTLRAQSETETMYADAGTFTYVKPARSAWKIFAIPYASHTSSNNGAYDIDSMGLVMGASHLVSDSLALGFHASVASSDSKSSYVDSDAISYTFGLHGVYNVTEAFYVRGQLSGFFAESDFSITGSTTANTALAHTDMDTHGLYALIAAGYDLALASHHVLTPELAVSHLYTSMDGYSSNYVDARGAALGDSIGMRARDYSTVYTDATLRWTGTFLLGDASSSSSLGSLKPTVRAGIRQALTDTNVESTLVFNGVSATTHSDANGTAFLCEAGLAWELDSLTTSLSYVGELGDQEASHMAMLKVEFSF